jgi:hypothetical protein
MQAVRKCLHAERVDFLELDRSRKMLVRAFVDPQGLVIATLNPLPQLSSALPKNPRCTLYSLHAHAL